MLISLGDTARIISSNIIIENDVAKIAMLEVESADLK